MHAINNKGKHSAYAYNPNTWEEEARGSGIQGTQLHNEFDAVFS